MEREFIIALPGFVLLGGVGSLQHGFNYEAWSLVTLIMKMRRVSKGSEV
jgi:hypothetical protein